MICSLLFNDRCIIENTNEQMNEIFKVYFIYTILNRFIFIVSFVRLIHMFIKVDVEDNISRSATLFLSTVSLHT